MEGRGRWGTRPFGCRGGTEGRWVTLLHISSPCSPSLPPSSETKPQLPEQPQQFAAQLSAAGAEAWLCGARQRLPNGLLSGTDKRSHATLPRHQHELLGGITTEQHDAMARGRDGTAPTCARSPCTSSVPRSPASTP